MNINQAMSICFKNKIKVYPIIRNGKFMIQFSRPEHKPHTYNKQLTKEEVNNAITKTYLSIASKL